MQKRDQAAQARLEAREAERKQRWDEIDRGLKDLPLPSFRRYTGSTYNTREQAARLAQLRRRQARLVARTSRCSACGARLGINPEPHAPYCPRRHRSTDG